MVSFSQLSNNFKLVAVTVIIDEDAGLVCAVFHDLLDVWFFKIFNID